MQTDATTPNIVRVTHCVRFHTLLHVVACRWGLLLGVVAQSLKPVGQTFEATTPNISFIP